MSAPANAPLSGAREARPSFLRRLVARAQARELAAFVVPGPEVVRAMGVDLEAAGLAISATPRHAGVLVLAGELPPALKKAAAVAHAQMPRPRSILAVGAGDVSPLPEPDAAVAPVQEEVAAGVAGLRRLFARGAFSRETADFDVDAISTQTEYVCPMHPEIVREEPGTCPICGMDLVPREAAGGGDHGAVDHSGHAMDHGNMDDGAHDRAAARDDEAEGHGGMAHGGHGGHTEGRGEAHGSHALGRGGAEPPASVSGEAGGMSHEGTSHEGAEADSGGHGDHAGAGHGEHEGDAPMGQGAGGSRSGHEGMDHGGMSGMDHGGMGHGGEGHMDHGGMGFMSMVEMTKDVPRSSDGLQMEWLEASFGPLFPGLPGGLLLKLTLDGDTVARAEAEGAEGRASARDLAGPVGELGEKLSRLDLLSPVAYRVLAWRAVEDAAGVEPDERTALARVGALEKERAVSHLGWLSLFGRLIGYRWLEDRAGAFQLALARADDAGEAARLRDEVAALSRRVERTPLIRRRLGGIGRLGGGAKPPGPVARAAGVAADARAHERMYDSLGFEPMVLGGDDALARLRVRLAEIEQSLGLVGEVGEAALLGPAADCGPNRGPDREGSATVETPRGAATLRVTLGGGAVGDAELDTPSVRLLGLVGAVAEQQELADALVGVASLDASPWGGARGVAR